MRFILSVILINFVLLLISPSFGLQAPASNDIFTISVAQPTAAQDVQVRYFLADGSGEHQFAGSSRVVDNKVIIAQGSAGTSPRSLKIIAYAPGCQFVTISVDDLALSDRQGQFECRPLPAVEFHGRTDLSGFQPQGIKLELFYSCDWAAHFFGISKGAVSPITLGKVAVNPDGSFTASIPDFTSDPLWPSLSNDATLLFHLIEPDRGHRFALQPSPAEDAHSDSVKVAVTYPPEMDFTVKR